MHFLEGRPQAWSSVDVFPFPLFVASLGFQANISNSLEQETAPFTGKVPAAGIFLFSSVPSLFPGGSVFGLVSFCSLSLGAVSPAAPHPNLGPCF